MIKTEKKTQSPILKSAIESFIHGLEHFISGSPEDRRFAILHIDQAVELMSKEKLVAIGKSIYKSNGETLNLHEVITSLEREKVKIPEKPRLEELHDIRNMVQHKGFTPDEKLTDYYVKISYQFIEGFLKEEMNEDIILYIPHRIKIFFEKEILTPLEEQIMLVYDEIEKNPSGAIINIFKALEFVSSRRSVEKLKETGIIGDYELENLKIARSLRNKVIHTLYNPSKDDAKIVVKNVLEVIRKIKCPLCKYKTFCGKYGDKECFLLNPADAVIKSF